MIIGAELINDLRQKRMVEQENAEKKILEKIRHKMERIKANQQRIQGPNYQDTTNHYVGKTNLIYIIIIRRNYADNYMI